MKNFLKYLWVGVTVCLVAMITFCMFFQPKHNKYAVKIKARSIKTTTFTKLIQARVAPVAAPQPEPQPEPQPAPTPEPVKEQPKLDVVEAPSIETQVGTMSAYGPDCAGCSGGLACGFNARGGNIIYNDATYGNVRIVAGDRRYPCGSIIKVSGSKLGDFNAIVLDRGGAIGIGKRFMFDLLFASEGEAAQFGTSYNVTFNLLRSGY